MLTFFSGMRTRKLAAIAATAIDATQVPVRATRAPHLIEGRSAAPIYGYDAPNSAPSSRDAMVQSLGN
jgi:hypothetical protein